MTHVMIRTHVIAPKELIKEVDQLVGPRHRSEFISEAVAEKLERENRIRAVRRALQLPVIREPGWETPEAVSKWVRDIRADSDPKDVSDDLGSTFLIQIRLLISSKTMVTQQIVLPH